MKFLFSTFSGIGHVDPLLAIAAELVNRGHTVHWVCGPRFHDRIVATGAHFRHWSSPICDADASPKGPDPGARGMMAAVTFARSLWVDAMPEQVKEYRRIHAEHSFDAIVVDFIGLGAYTFAEDTGIPYVSVATNPRTTFDHAETAPKDYHNVTVCDLWGSPTFTKEFIPLVNQARATLGMKSVEASFRLLDATTSPYLHLMQTTALFEDATKTQEPHLRFVGPSRPRTIANSTLPSWWPDLIKKDRLVIHVTQGTYSPKSTDPGALVEPTIRALAEEDCLVIATTPMAGIKESLSASSLPSNVQIEKFIPHAILLPHVDVLITNAGFNGTTAALSNGVPLVCAGTSEDKADVSRLVAIAGAGINLGTDRPDEESIRNAVRQIRADSSYKDQARRIQEDFQQHNSTKESCDLIETYLQGGKGFSHVEGLPQLSPRPETSEGNIFWTQSNVGHDSNGKDM